MVEPRKVLSVALIALILLSLANIVLMVVSASASPSPSSLEDWLYRRPITVVERSGNNLYNYSLAIAYNFKQLIMEGKVRLDLGDIRFTDSAGNGLPYYIETYGNATRLWNSGKDELMSYAVIGDVVYGHYAVPTPSAIWKYNLTSGALTVLYSDSTNRFTAWQAIYNKSEGKIYAAGQYYDGSVYRSTIFIIDILSDSVSYIMHPDTGDSNEFIGIDEWKNYIVVGERIYGGITTGSLYPNGGGVWFIPKDTITNTSTWQRIWENPNHLEIRRIKVLNDEVYVLCTGSLSYKPGFVELWKYDEVQNNFTLFINFTATTSAEVGFPADMDVVGNRLYIAVANGTDGSIHVFKYDGTSLKEYETGIPFAGGIHISMVAGTVNGKDILLMASGYGDIYMFIPDLLVSLHVGTTDELRIEMNHFVFDNHSLTLYPTTVASASASLYKLDIYMSKVWVKIPELNAGSSATIYMYYGNPVAKSDSNGSAVFMLFDDFSRLNADLWHFQGTVDIGNGLLRLTSNTSTISKVRTRNALDLLGKIVEVRSRIVGGNYINLLEITASPDETDTTNGWRDWARETGDFIAHEKYGGADYSWTGPTFDTKFHVWSILRKSDGTTEWFVDNTKYAISTNVVVVNEYVVPARTWNTADTSSQLEVDWVRVRYYVDPSPAYTIGPEEIVKSVKLPYESLLVVHDVAYSFNSTQFSHSFTATNATVATYETNYTDAYGWRVYANPYQSGGVNYENLASLVSEVNITLPYSEVLVENVTLLAKTNGTGSFRQLWVKVLNSTGGVVAELANASIGTGWTEVTLTVNVSLSNQITIWINATVKSTTTAGEEIAVKDVRVYAEYESNPQVTVPWLPNVDFFNCSASHYVELGSSEYLNSSVITFKLIQYLTYNATDYPIQPVYVGDETIGSHSYSVYMVDPANYSQYMTIYALLENKLKTFRTHAKGYDTETILVGEPLTVELPETGNVTVVQLNKTYANVLSVTVRFNGTGVFTIVANLTKASLWSLGYGRKSVTVKYGAFSVKPLDIDSKVVNYENIVLQLINSSGVVRELTGNQLFSFSDLWADNYTLVARFKDIVVANVPFELNITTDASTANRPCAIKSLARDYRGLNRSVVFEHDKQLLSVENVSSKYPFSRMRILLNGSGTFKLYINYRGDLPTKVTVASNVTNLNYYWDGNYLVITGTLGSVGELNVTDLYKLKIEIYDRLGNYMPSWIYAYINNTKYTGAVVEDYFYPEDYVVKLPTSVNGFEFYGFSDGFNESSRVVSINNTDVALKAWFRVPTSIEVRSYQVSSLWFIPFIKQEGETVKIYIEGYLRDYYGNGVPNRPLTVNITNVETKYTKSYNVTSDVAGYFRTPIVELVRGKTYIVEVAYGGDDIYVGTLSTVEVKPEELPVAPAVFAVPVEYLLIAVAAVLVAVGAFAAARAARQTVEELREKRRKFVKKKK